MLVAHGRRTDIEEAAYGVRSGVRDVRGMTALHYMLKKNSDVRHFQAFAAYGARGDIPETARPRPAILSRKRDPAFHAVAARLASERR